MSGINYKNVIVSDNSYAYTTYLKDVRKLGRISPEEEMELLDKYKETGDVRYKNRIIEKNQPFILGIAKMVFVKHKCSPLSDLINEGSIGLSVAIDKFDIDRGIKLLSFAVWYIHGYMLSIAIEDREKSSPTQDITDPVIANNERFTFDGESHAINLITQHDIKNDIDDTLSKVKPEIACAIKLKFGIDCPRAYNIIEIADIMEISKKRAKVLIYYYLYKMRDLNYRMARKLKKYSKNFRQNNENNVY